MARPDSYGPRASLTAPPTLSVGNLSAGNYRQLMQSLADVEKLSELFYTDVEVAGTEL